MNQQAKNTIGELNHSLFWMYEPILRKIASKIRRKVPYEIDEDDLYQDGCVLLLSLLDLGKIDKTRLCREYIWQRIGLTLLKRVSIAAKKDAIVWHYFIPPTQYKVIALDKSLATQLLTTKQLPTAQKQVLYQFYCMGYSTDEVAANLGLSKAKVHSLRTMAIVKLRHDYLISPRDKPVKYQADEFRVWEPHRPVDKRWCLTRWVVRGRQGARGKEYVKFFDSYNGAYRFYRLVTEKGAGAYDG